MNEEKETLRGRATPEQKEALNDEAVKDVSGGVCKQSWEEFQRLSCHDCTRDRCPNPDNRWEVWNSIYELYWDDKCPYKVVYRSR